MENRNDFDYIRAEFDKLPEITLPSSLSAESLWARVDAGELAADTVEPPRGKVVQWVNKMRPVLSYAAVFVIMVAVYYGAGLDSSPSAMPAPVAEDQLMMAAPAMDDAPVEGSGSHARMASPNSNSSGEAAAQAPTPMMAAPTPQDSPQNDYAGGDANAVSAPSAAGLMTTGVGNSEALESAVAMEKYLLSALSPKDYGGMHVEQSEAVKLHIWVVNPDAVTAAISTYPATGAEVVTDSARCSLADMKIFTGVLERIQLGDGETLRAYISEQDNTIAVNIAKAGEDRLRQQISALAAESGIPSECITVFTIDAE